ncbi:MAG: hypothetical protein DDT20_01856 [Firmicutes bacterium]|nr:hypothetical protein [Bacillota bacterium]
MVLTTAGYDRHSICYEKYQYAARVRDGIIQDPALLPVIYEAPHEADWTDPKTWKACNPGLGASILLDYLQREGERAQEVPAYEATFKRLHLNIWTEAETPFIRMSDWDACAGALPDLAGRSCYGGLDLASTQDLTSFALCFPPKQEDEPYYLLSFNWIPQDTIRERSGRDKVPYLVWHNQGHIQSTPGNAVDYRFVLADIKKLAAKYDIRAILFDRWGAARVAQDLEDEGLEVIAFGQGFKDMSPPTKELLKLVLSKQIRHNGNPVLRWCVSNMVVKADEAGNIKPDKKKSTEKIDSAVASIMALAGALIKPNEPFRSIYEDQGLTFI